MALTVKDTPESLVKSAASKEVMVPLSVICRTGSARVSPAGLVKLVVSCAYSSGLFHAAENTMVVAKATNHTKRCAPLRLLSHAAPASAMTKANNHQG